MYCLEKCLNSPTCCINNLENFIIHDSNKYVLINWDIALSKSLPILAYYQHLID